ncbi:hypothetical protein PXH78_09350 [Mycolicibacterium smegmatis]|uniref:hypothetical protein n=1 Tax=Mycolicibacterium smegmatis TaxID=1772 RepID=UPI0005D83B13|nr:hypothetical protein [Mycolicibacterium smegmatis]MDF1899073.1 hypothetical protein [Mycolicibacterium smegmatis]MDF1904897.1 hypothetical protein [Mycolicibacterium smegmatis]MDF1918766.1 hypothetical protein [Mycolicibacterium smegmatis]MDF1924061.1 hypothetical protein [Mycolicibacterium smegmatis]UAK53348.1 hypothetical protein K8P01_22410 [Mycolicibacterium smegmatis]
MKVYFGDQPLDEAVSVYSGGYAAAVYVGDTKLWPTEAVTTIYSTAGSKSYTFPTWFRLGVDYLDVIALGGGGGGYRPGSGQTQAPTDGEDSVVVVPTGSGDVSVTGDGGAFNSSNGTLPGHANGATAISMMFKGTFYFEPTSGKGGDGVAVTAGVIGRGGTGGSWGTNTLQPTGAITVTVGAGGLPRVTTFGSASPGNPGKVWIIAYPAE